MTDKLPHVMTADEWKAFIRAFNTKCPTGLRNAAIFTLMHDAGLRTCEVLALKASDIRSDELDGSQVTCLHLHRTKGDRERVVYLTPMAELLLSRWLEVKRERGLGRQQNVFTTLKGAPVKDAYLRELAARKGRQAGSAWRVHPHALRHTFATDLLEHTGDLALVQDALGHSNPQTTRVYPKVRNGRLAAAMMGRKRPKPADGPATHAPDPVVAQALQAFANLTPKQRAELMALVQGKGGE